MATNTFGLHKYHTSLTRIDYNKQENLLEITMKVFAHDLFPTLEKRHGKKIDLEHTKDIDKILADYINEKFTIKTKSGENKTLKFLGKEHETDVIYLYSEVSFEGDLEGAEIKNSLFFESFDEQVNLLTIRYGEKKSDLVFKVGDNFKTITNNKKKTAK